MTRYATPVIILSLTLLGSAGAMAQNPQTTLPPNPTVPVPPRDHPVTPPERIAPPSAADSNMSQSLSKDRGTIHPPAVDPGMTVAPPRDSTKTPVIPPPGSPGGNQSVVPK